MGFQIKSIYEWKHWQKNIRKTTSSKFSTKKLIALTSELLFEIQKTAHHISLVACTNSQIMSKRKLRNDWIWKDGCICQMNKRRDALPLSSSNGGLLRSNSSKNSAIWKDNCMANEREQLALFYGELVLWCLNMAGKQAKRQTKWAPREKRAAACAKWF